MWEYRSRVPATKYNAPVNISSLSLLFGRVASILLCLGLIEHSFTAVGVHKCAMSLFVDVLVLHAFLWLVTPCKGSNIDGDNQPKVGWVWDDGSRTTFDIIWGCLAVIIVCTYKVIHLNLPAERESDAAWSELLFWQKWLRKFKWMFFMTVSPELLFSMALLDWLWARESVRKFAQVNLNYDSSSLSHTKSTAEMIASKQEGRLLSMLRKTPQHVPLRYDLTKSKRIFLVTNVFSAWTQVHAHYANMYVLLSSCP